MLGIFFLLFTLSGFSSHSEREDHMTEPQDRLMFNWSHLTPSTLKDRYLGLGTENQGEGSVHFTLEGHKFLIFGGSIHYFRVPKEYWKDRLLKLKACGFNTVTTYIPWNLHEQERGKFDFSGNLDLKSFVLLSAKIGLWVILRPGPYICGEIDLGGLPSWLLRNAESRLRTTDTDFVNAVDKYFDHLVPRMLPLQYYHGGPVIAVQVENEYGSFNEDKHYMTYVKEALQKRGIVEMLLTSDTVGEVVNGSVSGAMATVNLEFLKSDSFSQLYKLQSDEPLMVMEYWTGWFDTWGDKHHVKKAKDVKYTVSEFIKHEISFNTYMFHGGTNFGFMNGAFNFGTHLSVVTSYDYDAILTEAGDYTKKYFKLRQLFRSVSATPLPYLPKLTPKIKYPSVTPSDYLPLLDVLHYLNKPVKSHTPLTMENLPINNDSGQPFGLVLYETPICSGGLLWAIVHDLAQVFLNDTIIGILNEKQKYLEIPKLRDCQLLRILVENQGRVHFSWKMQTQQKGLIGPVIMNGIILKNFTIYSLDMKFGFFKRLRSAIWKSASQSYIGPAFYRGTLKVGRFPTDTFLRLPGWHYGFVFINGRNLGRYWNIGPQRTLYLPGVWLHPEDNEIILFEKTRRGPYIKTTKKPNL